MGWACIIRLMENTILPYNQARRQIYDGDLIFFRGSGPVSSAIMSVTSCPFSHVELAQWNQGLLMTMGATSQGTVYRRLSAVAPDYSIMAVGRARRGAHEDGAAADKATQTALNHLGKPYDFARLAEIWIREKMGADDKADLAESDDAFICSEYVALAWRAAGLDLAPDKPDRLTTPADLYGSALVEVRFEFTLPG